MEFLSSIIGIVTLVFLALCVYRTIITFIHEKEKGPEIPVGEMTAEEVKNLLKEKLEFPFLKNIRTSETGDIDIEGKYGVHKVGIGNGKLYTYDKFKLFSNSKKRSEENRCLRFYLAKIIQPDSQHNPPKEFKKFKIYITACNIQLLTGIIIGIYLILMFVNELGGIDSLASKGVSEMYFTDYSEDISIGEALSATCSNSNWDSREGSAGLYYVIFSGNGANGSLLQIVFETDGNTCSVQSISMDGEDITLLQGLLFETLYEAASGGSTNDWSSGLEQNMDGYEQENSYEEFADVDNETILSETNMDEIVRTGTFWWQEGANEDARGAEITIVYDSAGQLWVSGKRWNSVDSVDIYYFVTNVYEDGSMIVECFDEENVATLYISPTENGGIFVEQVGVFYKEDLRFDGTYQIRW